MKSPNQTNNQNPVAELWDRLPQVPADQRTVLNEQYTKARLEGLSDREASKRILEILAESERGL